MTPPSLSETQKKISWRGIPVSTSKREKESKREEEEEGKRISAANKSYLEKPQTGRFPCREIWTKAKMAEKENLKWKTLTGKEEIKRRAKGDLPTVELTEVSFPATLLFLERHFDVEFGREKASFLVADTRLYTLLCRSVGPKFYNCERFSHYCSCPAVRDWIAVYPALFS